MENKRFFIVLWALLTITGIVSSFVIMFMAMHSPTLNISPFVALGVAWLLTLPQFGMLIATIIRKSNELADIQARMIKDIRAFCKSYKREHGYPPTPQTIRETISFATNHDIELCLKPQPSPIKKESDEK